MFGSNNVNQLFRVRKTLCKMLTKRGYLINPSEIELSLDEFKERYGDPVQKANLMLSVQKLDDPEDKIFVFFPDEEKLRIAPIRVYLEQMKQENVKKAIIVCEKDVTPLAKQAVHEARPNFFLEIFVEAELLVDITEHELVPEHQVLSNEEKTNLLKQYKLKEIQLPRMKPEDPVARYFGLTRGHVVKIIRASETAGRYVTYRIVL